MKKLRKGDLLYILSIDRLGRPVKEGPAEFLQIVDQWENKKIPMQEALRQSGMSESTFYRRRRELR